MSEKTGTVSIKGRLLDLDAFIRHCDLNLFRRKMTESQKRGTIRLVMAWNRYGNDLDTALAYVLATSYWETGRRMQPVLETFAKTRKQAARRLQNAYKRGLLKWVKTPYWRLENGHHWVGAGDVQLTHEYNYKGPLRAAVKKHFGVDIHENPDHVLNPEISAYILIEGLMIGDTAKSDFTHHELEKYINAHKTDFRNARKTVNPGDKSSYSEIAEIARKFLRAIQNARGAAEPLDLMSIPESAYSGKYHEAVRTVQAKLKDKGYPVGPIDGLWGPKTQRAVQEFREANGLPVEGAMDSDFVSELLKGEGQ